MMKKQFIRGLLVTTALIVVIATISVYTLTQPISNDREVVVFEVRSGDSVTKVAQNLQEKGFVRSSLYVRFVSANKNLSAIKAGEFALDKSWSVQEILETLNDASLAIPDQVRVTLPEGFWAKDIARRMGENTNVTAEELLELWNDETFVREMIDKYDFIDESIINPNSNVYLEGYLFPETYDFFSDTTAKAITVRLLDQTQRVYTRNKNIFDQSDLSVREVFILASIVQYEANTEKDMKLVAGVFYNRLDINMMLQSSPTVCYALYEFESWLECERTTNIDSLYNTYRYAGLPPGPILNPSEMALIATLNPTPSDYLYFMADVYGDGTVYYATNLAEHEANVDKYLRGR